MSGSLDEAVRSTGPRWRGAVGGQSGRSGVKATIVESRTIGLRLVAAEAEESGTAPSRAGDSPGHLRQALVGDAVPGEAVLQNHDPLEDAVAFAGDQRAWPKRLDGIVTASRACDG